MGDNSIKLLILKDAGFRYHFDREIYFNRQSRKAFSVEAIEDNDENWLQQRVNENAEPSGWKFYFNSEPSAEIRNALINELSQ